MRERVVGAVLKLAIVTVELKRATSRDPSPGTRADQTCAWSLVGDERFVLSCNRSPTLRCTLSSFASVFLYALPARTLRRVLALAHPTAHDIRPQSAWVSWPERRTLVVELIFEPRTDLAI